MRKILIVLITQLILTLGGSSATECNHTNEEVANAINLAYYCGQYSGACLYAGIMYDNRDLPRSELIATIDGANEQIEKFNINMINFFKGDSKAALEVIKLSFRYPL